ncbi:MFS transporter [Bacteroidota bacterium]
MTEVALAQEKTKYPRSFWVANTVEVFERAAFYGMFITMSLYLSDIVGFNDIWAGIIGAIFAAGVYFLPIFTGAYADKIGFKAALIIAFALLTIGYFTLAAMPQKIPVVIALLVFIMIGGSFIKSVITGTVAQSSTEANRAKAFSIFYSMVNIGSFTGKLMAKPIRTGLDLGPFGHMELGLQFVGYYSAAMTFVALIIVFLIFKNVDTTGAGKSIKEIWKGLIKVLSNGRLLALILIVSGFWLIQHQMYASMPKYIIRMVGPDAAPEWYANVNPAMVMIFVMLVTKWMRNKSAITSMNFGMLIMPLSVFFMSAGHLLEVWTGTSISIFGLFTMHPIAVMMILGIAFQGFAECFISPRFLEYFSKQAPKGEEGLYLGFAHLHSFFANFVGFFISGFLLDAFCPDPKRADLVGLSPQQLAPYYADAHYIWYVFASIGFIAAIALLIYQKVYERIDRKKEIQTV